MNEVRIYCLDDRETYTIEVSRDGENRMPCPKCSADRKKKKLRCFSYNHSKGTGHCMHCNAKFVKYKAPDQKKQYQRPPEPKETNLSDNHLQWLINRGISENTIKKCGLYTSHEWMFQHEKVVPVICFPYHLNGKLVNIKYRGPQKSFKLFKGGQIIPWRIDVVPKYKEVIIVEGEPDCLAVITAGFDNVISVPNGANTNLDYLDDIIEIFDQVEKIIIATDNDEKGRELLKELARRFGESKCYVVDFKDQKDANDYLKRYGADKLRKVIENTIPYPAEDISTVSDLAADIRSLFLNGPVPGKKIGVNEFDQLITWETGRLAVITGIPSHGKSEFLDFIIVLLNLKHGFKCGYFSPENHPVPYHVRKLAEKILGTRFSPVNVSDQRYDQVMKHIDSNFFFINPDENFTVDHILERAKYLVKTRGIRILVIDPYNRLEHQIPRGYTETQYISEFLDKLTNLARSLDLLIFLVAHPVKVPKETNGKYQVPNLYSISGSANFYNKTDFGLSVYRHQDERGLTSSVSVYVQKVKFRHLGSGGKADFVFNSRNGRYEAPSFDISAYTDCPNWLDGMENYEMNFDQNEEPEFEEADQEELPF